MRNYQVQAYDFAGAHVVLEHYDSGTGWDITVTVGGEVVYAGWARTLAGARQKAHEAAGNA